MAEGLVNHFLVDTWRAFSAGIAASHVNKHAIEVMREIDIDISQQRSKSIQELDDNVKFDLIVTVCDDASKQCPNLQINTEQIHLGFIDPVKYDNHPVEDALFHFRTVRDDIHLKLIEYLSSCY